MSTTRITIVKTAGRLGEAILQLFQQWIDLTKTTEPLQIPFVNVQIQDESIINKILSLTHTLVNHCDHPSVIWIQQFVDTWTIAPSLHAIDDCAVLSSHIKLIRSGSVDVMLLTAADRIIARCLKERLVNSRNQRGYSVERRFFLSQLRHCVASWQPFLESKSIDTVKFVLFHAIGPSRLDRDVVRMAAELPEWVQKV